MTQFFLSAHGLIERDGKFLFTYRAAQTDYKPLVWDTPGGTVEIGESPQQAVIREMKEEVNLDVKVGPPLCIYTNFDSFPERQYVVMLFQCKAAPGEIKLNPGEHSEYKWMTKAELVPLTKIGFLEEFLNLTQ